MLEQSDWHVMLLNQVHLDAGQMWGWTGASHVAYRFTYHVVLTDSVWMDLEGEFSFLLSPFCSMLAFCSFKRIPFPSPHYPHLQKLSFRLPPPIPKACPR